MIPIGITARNEAKNILALLDSLRAAIKTATAALGVRYEMHVLLNDNTDETPRLLTGVPAVRVWHTQGGIVEAQRTLVRRHASAPFIIFSDADILVSPDALLEVTRAMLADERVEIAYAEKVPIRPVRRTLLARALYFYNLREGYQTARHYFNGQFFAIRHWAIPRPEELTWERDNAFLNLAAGIRVDDIYISRILLRDRGPEAMRCVPAAIRYRPPETLSGMFRKYQRMRLEIERMDALFPDSRAAPFRWGRRRFDALKFRQAPLDEKLCYFVFWSTLCLCRIAYRAQRAWYMYFTKQPCPTWQPVIETKEPLK